MKNVKIIFILIILAFAGSLETYSKDSSFSDKIKRPNDNSFVFIENKGQWNSEVKFLAKLNGMNAWITKSGVVYDFYREQSNNSVKQNKFSSNHQNLRSDADTSSIITGHVVQMEFENSNQYNSYSPKEKQKEYYNYIIGNDSSKWASYVPLYKEIVVNNVYNGIDCRYYYDKSTLRYDFIVHPGADISQIKMKFEGQNGISTNEKGELVLKTSLGDILQNGLYAYQEIDGSRKEIKCKFILLTNGMVQFESESFNKNLPLIIDPLLYYSTYIANYSHANGIHANSSGEVYFTGWSSPPSSYPTTSGAYQRNSNALEVCIITKLNSTGSQLIFSTFLGGSQAYTQEYNVSRGWGIDVSDDGNIFVMGYTLQSDFPTTSGSFQTASPGNYDFDNFISKLNSDGSALIYSTYLGGTSDDYPTGLCVDARGYAYISGYTNSSDYPTTSGAYKTSQSPPYEYECFITKLNESGSSLVYSTFVGNDSEWDRGTDITIDSYGCAYIVNGTNTLFKLDQNGSNLLYSFNIPATVCWKIAIDGENNTYVMGGATHGFTATTGAYKTTISSYSGWECFVSKINPSGSSYVYSTLIGYGGDEDYFSAKGLAVDSYGNALISGITLASDFPTTECAFQKNLKGNSDCFVTKLNSDGSGLLYSTYLGGSGGEYGCSLAINRDDCVFVAGTTYSNDFPTTPGVYLSTSNGDIFVAKLNINPSPAIINAISELDFKQLICKKETQKSFYVKNSGECNLIISNFSLSGIDTSDFKLLSPSKFPVLIKENDSLQFTIKFAPKMPGSKTANLNLLNNSATNPYSISLIGVYDIVHVIPEAAVSDTLYINKTVCTNTITDISVNILNLSTVATSVQFSNPKLPFELININSDLSLNLGLSETKEIIIRFHGSKVNSKFGQLLSFTDTCGIIKYISVKVEVNSPLVKAGKDTAICNESSATIGDTTLYGTKPYQYEWTPTQFLYEANIAKPRTMPLKSNTEFYLKVTDALGCIGYDTVLVIVAPVMTLSAVPNQTVCKGNSAVLKPIVTGGLLPYKYKWTPAKNLNKPDTSNPIATPDVSTMYYYTITDSAGCIVHDSIMVYVKPNVKVNAGVDTTICPGYTITLTGKAEEGSTPYKSFKWSPATGLDDPNILSPKLRILKSGTYNYVLSVTDALDCIGRDTVMITITDPPEIQITGDTLICDGTVTVLAIEPKNAENTYLWSTGETTETITVNKAGKYSVEVTNKTGCTGLDTIEVKTYPKIIAKLNLDRSPELCSGSKLNISTEDKHTSYIWSTGNTEDNITVSLAGNYFVEVTDINGCKSKSDTVKVTLVDSLKPIVLVTNNGILCPNGSLNLTTEYNYTTYLWSTGETTKTITITQAGKYSVNVKDDGGCEGTSEIIDIIQGAEPKPVISGDLFLCPGRTSILLVQNDFKSYKWNTGETTKSISITTPGTYSVTVTDNNGCEGSASTTITEFKPDVIQLTDIDFGIRKVNSTSKKNIELKNTNTQQITIFSIKIKGIEGSSFTANPTPVPPKPLNQNESINIEIDYQPTASKSYLDSLIIDITEPCIQTIAIAVKGSASDSIKTQISTSVWIPDLSAKIGQLNFCIPLMAKKDDNEPYDDKVSYKAEITLDASVMNPTTNKGTIVSGKRTIEITGDNIQLTENPTKIGEICGQIFIGDRDTTPIEIITFEWSDKDIINKTTNGSIKVFGICQPNIARIKLFNPVEFAIKQTIVSNELEISTKNTTKDDIFTIYSIIGIEMGSYVCTEQMNIDISGLASGVYFVRIGENVGKFVKM